MQHISQLTSQPLTPMIQAGQTKSSAPVNKNAAAVVNKIFNDLKAIHSAWKQALSSDLTEGDIKKQFLLGFIESGVSDLTVINAALARSRASNNPFLPTIGQFIRYCREAMSERVGALDPTVAYAHLVRYYSKPLEDREPCSLNKVIYHTISQVGFDSYYFKTMDGKRAEQYFKDQYAMTIDYIVSGGELIAPVAPKMRIDSGPLGQPTQLEREYGNSQASALKGLFG